MSLTRNVLVVLAIATLVGERLNCMGIEVIENYYKGEKYQPEGRSLEEQYPYSSSHIAAASSRAYTLPQLGEDAGSAEGRKLSEDEEGSAFPYANLLKQLGMALHRTFIGNSYDTDSKDADEGRTIEDGKAESKKDDDNLHYHFYPHNQHLFKLPECATQQVCNAVYIRLNFTQPLCACPQGTDPCSVSTLTSDQRSIELKMGGATSKAITVIKTCEPVWSVRDCRVPRDWSILALQNTRTGKAHYLVICKCPDSAQLDGPLNHDQPTYAQVPGIRVYGMMCVRSGSLSRGRRALDDEEVM
ncbi:uncharacterized protein [Macrobrachium rosenbergii]|uniref:uncharacterized protein isoform X2 n=1 Tax=Macrobrachium rosenbergii TaxID=79674 RepID=UPI0034D41BB9